MTYLITLAVNCFEKLNSQRGAENTNRLTLKRTSGSIVNIMSQSTTYLPIGNVAAQAGVRVEAVRYYEREGLIPKARRGVNGYRQFSADAVDRIRFIQNAQSLGFSLQDIKELLSLKNNGQSRCQSVQKRTQAKLADIEDKIETLKRMRDALLPLLAACEPDKDISECPILNALDSQKATSNGR